MKIAVYTIVKNEEQFIERWFASCEEADLKLIVDTGSTDKTVEVAERIGCRVEHVNINPWRFDQARNAALNLIPEDYDYCIALDADEILVPGWRSALENVPEGTTRPRYKYVWSWNEDGTEGLVYSGDKIHSRLGYYWHHPVHEVLKSDVQEIQNWVDISIHHHPDDKKSRSQYLPLLELAVQEDPSDDRNRFYLGRELMYHGRGSEAKEHLLEHLNLSKWKPERATAMRYLSRVTSERLEWLLRACGESPNRREPWVELAQYYYSIQNWAGCLFSTLEALRIKEKPLEYLCEADSWGPLPHDLASIAAWNLSSKKLAVEQAFEAYLKSGDERIRLNIEYMLKNSFQSKIEVIIPFKSNKEGLTKIIQQLVQEQAVVKIHIVCDPSYEGASFLESLNDPEDQNKINIHFSEKSNIHYMWNIGLDNVSMGNHVAFINDDVSISPGAIDICGSILDNYGEVKLVCPNYDDRPQNKIYTSIVDTCRSRYNGEGGLAGFCFVVSSDIIKSWQFDESMVWWYGDDDILNHVLYTKYRLAAIANFARCSHEDSWTIKNDPPKNFSFLVQKDKEIFTKKWKTIS